MIHELESLVREGNFREVSQRLRKVPLRKISRREALAHANLARRVGLGNLSLRILNPIVRPQTPLGRNAGAPATIDEKIEYAASLRNLGAVAEAEGILKEIDARRHVQAGFHLALCLISQWQYASAIPLLKDYIGSFDAPAYGRHVGEVNLLASLIHESELEEGRKLIAQMNLEIDPSRFSHLYQRTLELAAQLEIAAESWGRAFQYLERARRLSHSAEEPINALLIKKWAAVAQSQKAGEVQPDLREVRLQAAGLGAWEIVRDCDFHMAKISRRRSALIRLFFGTPFESYRRKVVALIEPDAELPAVFHWCGDQRSRSGAVFDLAIAQSSDGGARLSSGQALHRLLIVLCQDFYRPAPLLSLFSKLFMGEYFQPETSPNRVHQVIKRLRRWIQEKSIPLAVGEADGVYGLRFNAPFSIAVPREPLPLSQNELELLRLRASFGERSFTAKEALGAIGSSRSAMQRLLKWASDNGKAGVTGTSHGTRYKLVVRGDSTQI